MVYSPMKIKKKFKRLLRTHFVKEIVSFGQSMGKSYVAPNSASIAFYFFISMIPLFILLCSQLPLTGISKQEMTVAVTSVMPETVRSFISSIISQAYDSRTGIFSFSMVILLWSSSKGVLALIRSLDIVYDVRDSRNIINMYMFSIFYTVCFLFAVSGSLVLYTKEITAEDIILSTMPSEPIYGKLVGFIKDFDVVAVGTLIATIVYKVAPAGKRKFAAQIPGALFASLAISTFTSYFASYSKGKNIYTSFYGSLTTVTMLLIWFYTCVNLFLMGAVINSHYHVQIEFMLDTVMKKLTPEKKPKKKDAKNVVALFFHGLQRK